MTACLAACLAAPQRTEAEAEIIAQDSNIDPDGSYQYRYVVRGGGCSWRLYVSLNRVVNCWVSRASRSIIMQIRHEHNNLRFLCGGSSFFFWVATVDHQLLMTERLHSGDHRQSDFKFSTLKIIGYFENSEIVPKGAKQYF